MTDSIDPVDRSDATRETDFSRKPHTHSESASRAGLSLACFTPVQLAVWLGLFGLSLLWCLPVRVRDAFGGMLGTLHYAIGRQRFRSARRNLRLCLPDLSDREVDDLLREHCATQWCVWFDLPALWMRPLRALRARTDIEGLELLHSRAEQGLPVVLLVCHNVALEHAAQVLKSMLPMLGYYRRFDSPVLEWLFYRLRSRNGGYLTERRDSMRSLLRDMRQGWQLYQMIDEDLGPGVGEFARFFSTDFCAVTSPARLCRLAGAEAIPVFSGYDRRQHRYRIKVFDPLQNFPRPSSQQDAMVLAEVLEKLIGESLPQFMWHQRLFRTRPDGQPSLYVGIRDASD